MHPRFFKFTAVSAFTAVVVLSTANLPRPSLAVNHEKLSSTSVKGFHLNQSSKNVGRMDSYVTRDFVRLDLESNVMSYIFEGRDGKVTILNHKDKKYFITDRKKWTPPNMLPTNVLSYSDFSQLRKTGVKNERFLSLAAQRETFKTPVTYDTAGHSKEERLTIVSADLISCPNMTAAPELLEAMTKLFCITSTTGYPVQFEYTNRKGGFHQDLTTKHADPLSIDSSRFKIPAGYAASKNEREIYLDSAGSDTLQDMLR